MLVDDLARLFGVDRYAVGRELEGLLAGGLWHRRAGQHDQSGGSDAQIGNYFRFERPGGGHEAARRPVAPAEFLVKPVTEPSVPKPVFDLGQLRADVEHALGGLTRNGFDLAGALLDDDARFRVQIVIVERRNDLGRLRCATQRQGNVIGGLGGLPEDVRKRRSWRHGWSPSVHPGHRRWLRRPGHAARH